MAEALRLRAERALARAGRPLLERLGYAIVWRNPRGYSLPTHVLAVLRRLEIDCVLDVGAHRGDYARLLRRYGYRGRIVSFEPVSANFERLAAAAAGDPRWEVRHAALGREDAAAEINVAHDTRLSSFLPARDALNPEVGTALAVEEREEVPVRSLDSVFDDVVRPDERVYLKLDTQGWDLEVLRGGERSLQRIRGLQTEVSVLPLYDRMMNYLDAMREVTDRGFELTGIYPVAYNDLSIVELDCVFIRKAA